MKRIFKYPVSLTDIFTIDMPLGAQVLSVQTQNGNPFLWALVDPEEEKAQCTFRLVGTGHPLPDQPRQFVGTFQMGGGALVLHLFLIDQPLTSPGA